MNLRRVISQSVASAVAAAVLLLLVSCASSQASDEGRAAADPIEASVDPVVEIVGVWKAPEPANQDAFAEFTDFGLWFASDGCNGTSAGYRIESDGSFSSLGGIAMTQAGCNNEPIPNAVSGAVSVAFDAEGQLILIDEEGGTTVLIRMDQSAASLVGAWAGPGSAEQVTRVDFAEDGTWRGFWGCHEFGGTWSLGIRDDLLSDPDLLANPIGGPPILLSTGPTEPKAICTDGPTPEFPLAPETDYWFDMRRGSFWIRSTADDSDLSLSSSVPTFYRIATEIGTQ